jgi:2-keto-3-deoxy-6-phosphogluconate aldolase
LDRGVPFLPIDANVPTGVVAMVSAGRDALPDDAVHALVRGGVRYVDVAPVDALATVRRWSEVGGDDAVVGMLARTVADVRKAVGAGARFVRTPTLSTEVLESAAAAGVAGAENHVRPAHVRLRPRRGRSCDDRRLGARWIAARC